MRSLSCAAPSGFGGGDSFASCAQKARTTLAPRLHMNRFSLQVDSVVSEAAVQFPPRRPPRPPLPPPPQLPPHPPRPPLALLLPSSLLRRRRSSMARVARSRTAATGSLSSGLILSIAEASPERRSASSVNMRTSSLP